MVTMGRGIIFFNVIVTGGLVRKKGYTGKRKGLWEWINYSTSYICMTPNDYVLGVFYKVDRPINVLSLWLKVYLL